MASDPQGPKGKEEEEVEEIIAVSKALTKDYSPVLKEFPFSLDLLLHFSQAYLPTDDFSRLRRTCRTLYHNQKLTQAFKLCLHRDWQKTFNDLSSEEGSWDNKEHFLRILDKCAKLKLSGTPADMDQIKEIYDRLVQKRKISSEITPFNWDEPLILSLNKAIDADHDMGDNRFYNELIANIKKFLKKKMPSKSFINASLSTAAEENAHPLLSLLGTTGLAGMGATLLLCAIYFMHTQDHDQLTARTSTLIGISSGILSAGLTATTYRCIQKCRLRFFKPAENEREPLLIEAPKDTSDDENIPDNNGIPLSSLGRDA